MTAAAAAAAPAMPAHGRTRLRPTRHASRFVVVLSLMLLASVNYQSNAAWLLAMAVGGMAAASLRATRRNLHGLEVTSIEIAPGFAGDPLAAGLRLRSAAPDGAHGIGLSLPECDGDGDVAMVPADGGAATVAIEPRARGAFRVTRLVAESSYPLGLVRGIREIPCAGDGVVWPRPDGAPLSVFLAGRDSGDGGHASIAGNGDFAGHRRYEPGDSEHRIDWRAAARERGLLVKTFAGGVGVLRLAWSDCGGDDETRLSQLARWVVDADEAGLRYALLLPAGEIPGGSGPTHREACLRALALHPQPVPEMAP